MNCGSGKSITIKKLAEQIRARYRKLFNVETKICLGNNSLDTSNYTFNINRIISETGINPNNDITFEIDNFLKFISDQS